jgi:hypothetical protein
MTDSSERGRTLRATLCEVEHGLFYVTYPGHVSESELLELPTYGLGASAIHVRQEMEKSIRTFGYETVIWEAAPVFPQPPAPVSIPAVAATRAGPLSQ